MMYNKKVVFWAACLGIFLFGIGIITLGSVAPYLKTKFALDEIASGTLFSILPIGILAGSLIFGPVCDRYGYKLILVLSCIGMALGFEGIAYANSFLLLKFFIFLFGAGGGIINGATSAMVSDISSEGKGANLSLLGVFFGVGALGMPFVLGLLKGVVAVSTVVAVVGLLTLAVGIFYLFIKFPSSKKAQGFQPVRIGQLFKERLLLLIAFFLFCQSSFEGIINNWTTTYLTEGLGIRESNALFALSLQVAGLTVMRLLIGSVFRSVSPQKLIVASLILILLGTACLHAKQSFWLSTGGLILLGAGLAGGFPIMLGIAGTRYAEWSGTAFSFALCVALIGNMLVNYTMGVIANRYGIQHLTTVAFAELAVMIVLSIFLFQNTNYKENLHVSKTMAE